MEDEKKIAVIGGGSWATALVKILCNNVSSVNWYMRNENAVSHILKFRHNPKYLQSVEFDLDKINVSTDLQETIRISDIVIIATPSAFLVKLFEGFPNELFLNTTQFRQGSFIKRLERPMITLELFVVRVMRKK